MNACRKATKISSIVIATLPATAGTAMPNPMAADAAPALRMKPSSTASRMWPASMLANRRTVSAKILAIRPAISTGTSTQASHQGPGQKCAK